MRGLKGKTAIVTGGAAGIGAAVVQRFKEKARGSSSSISRRSGRRHHRLRRGEEGGRRGRPVDILVNNAGWDMFKPFLKTDPAFWQKIISINLIGAMNLLHCVLPGMVERGRGKVVNVASDAGRVGSSGEGALLRVQGRDHRAHQDAGARDGFEEHPAERGMPGPHRNQHARAVHAGRGQPGEAAREPIAARSRWGAWASPKTFPARSCSSRATTPTSSPARS